MSDVFHFICSKSTPPVSVPSTGFDQQAFNRRSSATFRALGGGHLIVGRLVMFPLRTVPDNHLLCDGSAISRKDFAELFAYLGTSSGSGNGTTTFNIPDYRGATLLMPAATPVQTISAGGTVSTGGTVTSPTGASQTGGTSGGNVLSGGRVNDLP